MNNSQNSANNVRHSYPIAIRDDSIKTAFGLLLQTLPYALIRFGILLAVSLVTLVWAIVTFGGAAFLGDKIHGIFGFGWLAGLGGIYGYIWYTIVRYGLYLIKCGHIAVLTELITHGQIGNGDESMFAYGRRIIQEKFTQVNVLFALDLLIDGVVKAFNNTLDWIGSLLPIPGLDSLMKLVNSILFMASTYIDETIFSYSLARGETNPWRGGQDGLLYYCNNVKEILKTALWAVILDKVCTFLLWAVFMAPAMLFVWISPFPVLSGAAILAAFLCAANARSAFLEPLFLIMVMIKFHVAAENQPVNLDWDSRLTTLSSNFVEIKEKAAAWVTSTTPAPAPEAGQAGV